MNPYHLMIFLRLHLEKITPYIGFFSIFLPVENYFFCFILLSMATQREKLGITQEALPSYIANLAIKLMSTDNTYVPASVYQVLEIVPTPNLPFSELNSAQQAVVIKFLQEVLPQFDITEYQELAGIVEPT